MSESYNCSPQPRETIVHKVSRTFHNIFHPRHKQLILFPPLALVCKEPEMETITVVADSPRDIQYPPELNTINPDYGIPYGMIYPGSEILLVGGRVDNPTPHSSVPEPSTFWLLVPAFLFVLSKHRFQRR